MRKIALITGATAGIGEAIAHRLAAGTYDLILSGRRGDKLDTLCREIESRYHVKTLALCFDVRNAEEVQHFLGQLPADWQAVDVLINNAGLAVGMNSTQEGLLEDWERMIDTNIKGLLYVSRTILPGMVARKRGHVINIGSIAGKEVYPNGNVYCATKYAVDALTKGMRMDTLQAGLRVTGIHPGMVETEFSLVRFKGDSDRAERVYEGLQPLKGEDIAEAVWFALSQPAHVNISEMVLTPSAQASATQVVRNTK
jgi:3-hydroxy acid dehydrogenase / malonic semialdehyde reductase